MKKAALRLFLCGLISLTLVSCGSINLRGLLNDLKLGMTRQEILADRNLKFCLHTTEFEQDERGNNIERLIYRVVVYDSAEEVGHEWVTLWLKNGILVEKTTEFVPKPRPYPGLPMPLPTPHVTPKN